MKEPEVIVVLSSGIKQVAGRWASTDLTEEDNQQGAPGGSLRVLAAAVLSNRYSSALVIANGGKGYDVPKGAPEDRPLLCEILKEELVAAGVTEKRIELERVSNTTYQQLQQLELLMKNRGWSELAVVSNRWHVPRIHTMLERKFPELRKHIQLISAEDVLIADNSDEWEDVIERAYASEWLARRVEGEERGIAQIKDGTYQFR